MLRYFTIVSVVFLSSPCSIFVVSTMFPICLRCLHLFVYSFKRVIQIHHIASIHLRGCHEREKWKIELCSTFRLQKCLCLIKYKYKEWITVLFEDLGTWGAAICIYVARPLATSSSWNLSHPSEKPVNWGTKYIPYDTNQLQLKRYEVNSINNPNDIPQSTLSWFPKKLPLLMAVCYLEALKNKRSSRTWLTHPSSSTTLIEAEFFWKNRKYISTLPGSSE